MAGRDVRLLFVGLGSIGRRHLGNAHQLGVRDLHVWRRVGAADPPVPIVAHPTLEAALAARPDAVFVCNPTSLHVETAMAAARAGCHLFIEKPLSASMDGIDDLVEAVRARGLVSLMGLTLRFHPALRQLAALIERGALGRIVSVRSQVGQYLPDWRPAQDYRQSYSARRELGGGVVLDLIHEIDYTRWLGGEIARVFCRSGSLSGLEIDTEDVAELVVDFASGAIGSVHLDYVQRCPTRSCTVIGTEGTAVADLMVPELRVGLAGRGWETTSCQPFERNTMFVEQMEHFLGAIRGEHAPCVDVQEGATLQRIAMAAHASNASGRAEAPA